MPRRFFPNLAVLLAASLALAACATAPAPTPLPGRRADTQANLKLRYDGEAKTWMADALPIGNGRMGAMLFGGVDEEKIQFNEESLWLGDENDTGKYQNFGELRIKLPGMGPATDYRRELDLNRAVHTVAYARGGVRFRREAFASYPGRVIAVRFGADKPGAITAEVAMRDAHGAKPAAEGGRITLAGSFPSHPYDGGKTWPALTREAQVRVVNQGGTRTTAADGSIRVEGADSLVLLLDAGTDFLQDRKKNWRGPLPHDALTARLDANAGRDWDDLLAEHERDYRRLFNRLSIDLGGAPSALPTDERLRAYPKDRTDAGLEELLFQYGRYLMIASSRPGCLPANLQGKWCDSNNPPWRGDYHTDINVEMNYWLPDPANLSECFQPFADWIESIREVRSEATRKAFGARGWAMRGESGPFGGSTWEWTPATSAWLMENAYGHYRFTGDKEYLRTRAYPAMKEVCAFWLDRLEALPDGTLVAPRDFSPENHVGFREHGVAFDQQWVWDLFTGTLEASEILGVDADLRAELAAKRAKLGGPKIGRWGQLQEWWSDRDDPKEHHRHTSHLVGLYPGRQITPEGTPALAKAAAVSLAARGEETNGWALAWRMALWGRLHDGERAHRLLSRYLIRPVVDQNTAYDEGGGGIYPNLLCACPPFQIDGNFGYPAAVCDLLAQSHESSADGTPLIRLLPALPKAWATGHVRGLGVRGGLKLDMDWQAGKVTAFALKGPDPKPVQVRVNGETRAVVPEKCEGEARSEGR